MRLGTFIWLYLFPLNCLAQIPSDSRALYTRKDGLSNNTVTAVVKDNRGFLWIGTSEGLNRFDGTHFSSYFSDLHNNATLSGNNVYDILQYQPDKLLIATDNGLSVLNTITNRFENETITMPALQRGSGIYIRSLFQDAAGQVYVNYSGEIDVFTRELKFLYRLTDRPWARALKGIIIYYEQWVQDSKGRIWLPSDNYGICMVDMQAQQVWYCNNNPLHYPFLRVGPVRSFYYDEKNEQVFFSMWGSGVEKYDMKTGRSAIQNFDITDFGEAKTFNAITRKDNRLICCGGQSIYSLDPETMQYENISKNITASAATPFINGITVLNDGDNIWVGTETKGLLQIPCRTDYLQQVPLPYKVHDYTRFSTSILAASNNLLYFAYGEEGLVEIDQQQAKALRYKIVDAGGQHTDIYRIRGGTENDILLGTSAGFYTFNTKTKKFSRTGWLPATTDKLKVKSFSRDREGNIWASFFLPNALGYYDNATRQFNYYPDYIVNGKRVFNHNNMITRMTEDSQGNTWMTSFQINGGMSCYEKASGNWKVYPSTPKAKQLFTGRELTGFCIIDNIIWTGNIYGLGLVRYDYRSDSLRRIGRKDGLLSDNIFSITKDQRNNLFLSTKAGINYFNTTTNEIRTLITDDGNIDWGFAYVQYYDTVNNQLIYGLNDRIVIANSKLWEEPVNENLRTYIDDIKVNNTLYPFNGSPLQLTHNQKSISIHFTGINYNKNATLLYAYKMNGIDKDWTYSQQVNTTNYSNLSPGHYTFLVKTKTQSGKWGPVNDSIRIIILPAVWQTTWFWVLTGLVTGLLVVWLVRRRISNIRKGAELKQKLAETEMMALRSQMNPHFIFNCLNAIDNLMQTNQPDKATTYLTRFARLIRSVLENSKNNVVPFHKDLETLQLYLQLEQFRASNKFSYELHADEELVNGDYKIPPLIVQPFVENAIQHGLLNKESGDRKLLIDASLKGDFIQYTISDNGVGRAKGLEIKERNMPEHKSYGIQITTERLQLHNRNGTANDIVITDLSGDGLSNGTKIEVRIKIDQ
jgi:ligand-binding sensor domain-containing protein/anti-sigma regulatory factor (Ser/Thr protein kinase)